MIKEKCPKCGGEIGCVTLMCYPPIHEKRCSNCGTAWRHQDEIVEETFDPRGWKEQ